ncbi:hypothetical protein MMC28_007530 [Mycoblastus sanguinarius]|nr:hypothetical protein [Mycoblastus sanguinarius]
MGTPTAGPTIDPRFLGLGEGTGVAVGIEFVDKGNGVTRLELEVTRVLGPPVNCGTTLVRGTRYIVLEIGEVVRALLDVLVLGLMMIVVEPVDTGVGDEGIEEIEVDVGLEVLEVDLTVDELVKVEVLDVDVIMEELVELEIFEVELEELASALPIEEIATPSFKENLVADVSQHPTDGRLVSQQKSFAAQLRTASFPLAVLPTDFSSLQPLLKRINTP